MMVYARLRMFTSAQTPASWDGLRSMGPINRATATISIPRAYRLAALLHHFDFNVRYLTLWLIEVYTHDRIPLVPIHTS